MDTRYPRPLRHARSSGSVLHNAPTTSQHEAQRLRPTKSSYFRRVIDRPHDEFQQPRRTKSSYFARAVDLSVEESQSQKLRHTKSSFFRHITQPSQDSSRQPRRTKSSYFRHTPKPSQDPVETKPQTSILSKLKTAFRKSHARSKSSTPSQLASKLQMSRLEYRLYALNHYSTPQQYHRIHLSSIVFHHLTGHLLLVKDPIGRKFSLPETAMFSRHSTLGEALSEGLFERTGLRIREVKREVLPVWEFEGNWRFGEGEGMKSCMLNFVVEVEGLEEAKGSVRWVGEEDFERLEMDRGMRNLVRWVFDERVCAEW